MTASESPSSTRSQKDLPFGAGADGGDSKEGGKRRRSRRGGRRRRRKKDGDTQTDGPNPEAPDGDSGGDSRGDSGGHSGRGGQDSGGSDGRDERDDSGEGGSGRRRRGRRSRGAKKDGGGSDKPSDKRSGDKASGAPREGRGMFVQEKGGISVLRREENQWLASKDDVYVPKRLVQVFKLRDGMIVEGRVSKGFKHKLQLDDVSLIDGKEPKDWKHKLAFKNLTSIDPDFHYQTGDILDEVSMRVVDLIAPIGRGQRALLVAPPRSGKTTILRQFAAGIEKGYPDVHLMVLLIDERPEEATEWQRSVEHGQVFVSTADETSKHHIEVAEAAWKRACRLVEMGEDVVMLLDSITRLARAYNNQAGSGRTMSGGLDSRAMERPRKIFGSARNTVEAGSLTIVGTCLVDTGSRMDQLVFEEFKGTGNSELVLNRKLADRRIFPAIDVEKSGTRKEEKLVGTKRLKQIHTLRRVVSRMHFAEAMDLLITRLGDVDKTNDFLERFTIDPEA